MSESTHENALEARLRRAESEKQGRYEKRTEHLDAEGRALFINRLILEDSPYLLQHAHNPVNWYAWGDEAFAAARVEDKPIFLSIGYSTCHWCHVMEVESFDNIEVAQLLNAHYISIKLDREQYPDIDEVYMTGVQIVSGQGGWPMSNFLLPDGRPFYGATYFPAANFKQLLRQIADAWQPKREELEKNAVQISAAIDRFLSMREQATQLDPQLAESALQGLLQREDRTRGGLAGAPKFPQEPLLLLLLDRGLRDRELPSLAFIERALEGMAAGGIYDQIGGGFHRYSVDSKWLVPHFEKMLYNQSQLGLVYLQAALLTDNPSYHRVCAQTLDYVLRDMQLPEGGFYSATDADSEGDEGTFFVWTPAQLAAALTAEELALVRDLFDISDLGNFEGANVLSLKRSLNESAVRSGRTDFYDALDRVLGKLYQARERRVHPLRDDKLIVAWTAAMMTTLVRAGAALEREDWIAAAEKAAALLWRENVVRLPQGLQLQRIYLNGAVSIAGQLEDYVNLAEAFIALFDVTASAHYLMQAQQVMAAAITEFWDAQAASFYLSPRQAVGPQLTRSRSASDGATLSPVATALQCVLALQQRKVWLDPSVPVPDPALLDAAFGALLGTLNDSPLSHPSVMRVLAEHQRGSMGAMQYVAEGRARLMARKRRSADGLVEISVHIHLHPDWHLTAPQSTSGHFVPVALVADEEERHWQLVQSDYPSASAELSTDSGLPVAIYVDKVVITATFKRTGEAADGFAATVAWGLHLQLCNDHSCLLPEVARFRV